MLIPGSILGGNREVDNWYTQSTMQDFIYQTFSGLLRPGLEDNLRRIMKGGRNEDGSIYSWITGYLDRPRALVEWHDRLKGDLTSFER